MSVDLSCPVNSLHAEEMVRPISSELLIHFAGLAIDNGLALINDVSIEASLIEPQGEILWLSDKHNKPLKIAVMLSKNTCQEMQFQLFTQPIEEDGVFYYLAPVLGEDSALIAIVVFASQTVNSMILLALAHSVGREISEKIKRHLHLQAPVFEKHSRTNHRELNIQEVEKSATIEAAYVCCGKIQEMHQVLNMGRTTLWRKLKQYDINIKDYTLNNSRCR